MSLNPHRTLPQRCFFPLLGFALFIFSPLVHAQMLTDGIAAVVNDKIITYLEIKQLADGPIQEEAQSLQGPEHEEELQSKIKEIKLNILKSLIERELIIQDFKKNTEGIPALYIDQQVQYQIKAHYGGDRETLIRSLSARGVTMEKFREEISNDTIVTYMRGRNVSSNVLVSPYQIEKFYQENLPLFKRDEQIKISIIILQKSLFPSKKTGPDGKEIEYDPQFELAKDIVNKLNLGADFGDMAKQFSISTTKDEGGVLGWVTQNGTNALRQDLWPAVAHLQPGQISDVITTTDGYYYIIQVNERRKGSIAAMEDVRKDIENVIINEETQKRQDAWLDGLKAKAFIKMF